LIANHPDLKDNWASVLRIVAGIALLVVVRFGVSNLDSVVGQSEAYLRIAGILIGIILAGHLISTAVELKRRKAAGQNGTALFQAVEDGRVRVA